MINVIIDLYRSWPFRPHCNATAGYHAWTCRIAGFLMSGEPQVPDCKHRK